MHNKGPFHPRKSRFQFWVLDLNESVAWINSNFYKKNSSLLWKWSRIWMILNIDMNNCKIQFLSCRTKLESQEFQPGVQHKPRGLSQLNAKWKGSISTTDRPCFYRTNVFKFKLSHSSKQWTSLCLNSKRQTCQNWKWIRFVLHSIDSAREASAVQACRTKYHNSRVI